MPAFIARCRYSLFISIYRHIMRNIRRRRYWPGGLFHGIVCGNAAIAAVSLSWPWGAALRSASSQACRPRLSMASLASLLLISRQLFDDCGVISLMDKILPLMLCVAWRGGCREGRRRSAASRSMASYWLAAIIKRSDVSAWRHWLVSMPALLFY